MPIPVTFKEERLVERYMLLFNVTYSQAVKAIKKKGDEYRPIEE